jgi:SAM-dependent methyltransferase
VTPTAGRPWYETAFGPHYPLLYAHRDLTEARRCVALLPALAPLGPGPILDLGCGQGRHLHWLAGVRLPVLGLDLSWSLLTAAKRAAGGLPVIQGDMRAIPLRAASCSAVLSLFTTFGYFGGVRAHDPVVREVARVLAPGGHWFLDFLDSERVAAQLQTSAGTRRRRTGALLVEERRELADQPRRVIKTITLQAAPGCEPAAALLGIGPQGLRYVEEVTLFSLDELTGMAAAAGLQPVAAAGDYAGARLVPGASERWLLVYRRGNEEGAHP